MLFGVSAKVGIDIEYVVVHRGAKDQLETPECADPVKAIKMTMLAMITSSCRKAMSAHSLKLKSAWR